MYVRSESGRTKRREMFVRGRITDDGGIYLRQTVLPPMSALAAALHDAACGDALPRVRRRSADITVALLHDDAEDDALVDADLGALLD